MAEVLHVIRATGVAGAERQLLDVLRAPGWDGFRLTLEVLAGPGLDPEAMEPLPKLNGGVLVTPMPHDLSPAIVRSLRADFRRYDIVHTHLVHADWHALAASAGRRARWVSSKHNPDRFRTRRVFRAVERQVDRRADRTIAISESLADFTRATTGVRPEVVPYGCSRHPVPPRPVREAGPFSLLAIGRLVPQKGFDVAIRAMPAITRSAEGTVLTIAGDGPERRRLERLARAVGVDRSVRFVGWVEDGAAPMARHDLLVHPARWEGFGLVLLEAMAARLPVVASTAGAIPEVMGGLGAARLVPPEQPELLAGAVLSLLDSSSERERLAEAAARRLREEFSMERAVQRISAIYGDVQKRPSGGSPRGSSGARCL